MKLNEVSIKNYKSKTILSESWQQLSESQQLYIGKWEENVWPLLEDYQSLLEKELDSQQIQKIFKSAEQVAIASGKGKTALGKTGQQLGSAANKIKQEVEKLATAAQKTKPVQNFDAQFEKIKKQLSSKLKGNPNGLKILKSLDSWKQYATDNPVKSSFAIGAMTTLLAFASGGIASGAAIGLFMRTASNTIKGDQLSSAVGKAASTAAVGAIAGAIGDIWDNGNIDIEKNSVQEPSSVSVEVNTEIDSETLPDAPEDYLEGLAEKIYNEATKSNFSDRYKDQIIDKIVEDMKVQGSDVSLEGSFVQGFYLTSDQLQEYQSIVSNNGGGLQGATSKEAQNYIKSVYDLESQSNVESFDNQLWDSLELYELNILGAANKAADAIGNAVAKGAKETGKQLANNITSKKLLRMWKKSGSPNDLDSIINILQTAGLDDKSIGTVSKQARISLDKTVNIDDLAQKIIDNGLSDIVKKRLNPKAPQDRKPINKKNPPAGIS